MKIKSLIYLLALILTGCSIQTTTRYDGLPDQPIDSIPNELRGAWVTRFSWVDADAEIMKQNIIGTMKKLADANFNAVFFQVRGQAETLYPSPIEPWSKLFGFKSPGFDPVKLAVEEAHKNGLQFYAYINLLTMWNEDEPPADTSHIYYKHGPNVKPNSSWLCFSELNKPMERNEYYYLNPGNPEVKTYLKSVIKHFVENYDVDGLHFDRIRYPGQNYILDNFSMYGGLRMHNRLSPDENARILLTDLVEDVVVEAMMVKPYLVNSASTWGIYKNDGIEGYDQFSSGYDDYYQDAIDWLDKGIMDFIVPMIYWDIQDPAPNFDDLWRDFKKRTSNYKNIFPGLQIHNDWVENGETINQINFVRQNGGLGTVLFSIEPESNKKLSILNNYAYPTKASLPINLKRLHPDQVIELDLFNILVKVKSLGGILFLDSNLTNSLSSRDPLEEWSKYIRPEDISGKKVEILNLNKIDITDSNGKMGAILPKLPDTLVIKIDRVETSITTDDWEYPYNYVIEVEGAPKNTLRWDIVKSNGSVNRKSPWVEFRRTPRRETNRSSYPFLAKTEYPAKAWINDNPVKVYKTGIFFNDVDFEEGPNRVEARIEREDSSTAMYVQEFNYKKVDRTRTKFPLWIDERSIEPNYELQLLEDDIVKIKFDGSKGQHGSVQLLESDHIFSCFREDKDDHSTYTVEIPMRKLEKNVKHKLKLILRASEKTEYEDELEQLTDATITVKDIDEYPLVKTSKDNARLTYTLGQIRLGGPMRAEYPPDVILKTSGKINYNYRIKLSKIDDAYIDTFYVDELPLGTPEPKYYLTSLYCTPTDSGDIIRIPYPENVPYAIYPEPNQKRILIDLYGVETSSTWLTHKSGRKIIDKVTWQQTTPETYQIIVNLNTSKIWGYDITQSGKSLIFRIKYPPEIIPTAESPLKGLKIAIEAGHGGANVGAVGLSGILEKDINLDLSLKLGELCKKMGAEILQVRDTDRPMYLSTKRDTSRYSGADIHISIHANSGGSRGGYLGVSGTSHYYHNPFWAPLAEMIHNNVLEMDIDEFGVVGSFNYTVTRMTEMPAILVEQAFMSHAEDEEKLANENFRQEMAEKIYKGILEYINYMRSE